MRLYIGAYFSSADPSRRAARRRPLDAYILLLLLFANRNLLFAVCYLLWPRCSDPQMPLEMASGSQILERDRSKGLLKSQILERGGENRGGALGTPI